MFKIIDLNSDVGPQKVLAGDLPIGKAFALSPNDSRRKIAPNINILRMRVRSNDDNFYRHCISIISFVSQGETINHFSVSHDTIYIVEKFYDFEIHLL